MSFHPAAAPQAATDGLLFNRKDPRNADGEIQPILNRRLEPRDGVRNSVFNEGRDFTSLEDRHKWKYRIPDDSVVNKVGDCKLGLCFGWRLTAAQWIWVLNLICFAAHTTMVFLTAYFAWWSKDLDKYGDENPYLVKVYRISARWNNDTLQGYDMTIEDNGMPIDIAWGTILFFLISAVFHLWAVVVGLFEATWFWYWRQLDDAFAPWRWIEYSFSCSWMGLLLALTLGIREQNTLACLFMLLWTTQWLGFLNELYSRVVIIADKKSYKWPAGRLGYIEEPDYKKNPNALHLLSQKRWEGDRPLRDEDGKVVATSFDYVHAQRTSNYIRRQVPYLLGWFPFMTYVVCIVYHLEYQKWRLHEDTNGDTQIPAWVNALLYGTISLFASFAFVMPLYQYLPPGFYWGTEIVYAILSLTAKMFLGMVILINVLMSADRAEDVLAAGSLQQAR